MSKSYNNARSLQPVQCRLSCGRRYTWIYHDELVTSPMVSGVSDRYFKISSAYAAASSTTEQLNSTPNHIHYTQCTSLHWLRRL